MIRSKARRLFNVVLVSSRCAERTVLTDRYRCDEAWEKRFQSPLLSNLKMEHYFVETDKKFGMKNTVSGIDIDLFANNVQDPSQLEELEHLLYRFRKTQRSFEIMDSTVYATVRTFLKLKDYESLHRILKNPESYGIFPDYYAYNILMDTFIKENMFKEATEVAILLMLQEDFSNKLNCLLAIYSCQMFMKKCPLESLAPQKTTEEENATENENEEEEEQLVRVPFLRNDFFDDHFHLTKPEHLIGKTFFLAGQQIGDEALGATYQLYGLALHEKWDKLFEEMKILLEGPKSSILVQEGVDEINKLVASVDDEKVKEKMVDLLSKLQKSNKVLEGKLEDHLNQRLQNVSSLEQEDITSQQKLFDKWENKRKEVLMNQNLLLDKQKRLEEIAKKKEYLHWKEKLLFFFENENKVLDEYQKAQELMKQVMSTTSKDDAYVPPEIVRRATPRLTKYQRLTKVKQL